MFNLENLFLLGAESTIRESLGFESRRSWSSGVCSDAQGQLARVYTIHRHNITSGAPPSTDTSNEFNTQNDNPSSNQR